MDDSMSAWRASSYSGSGGGNCVEVGQDGGIVVRDTKNRDGVVLAFEANTWRRMLKDVKADNVA